MKQNIEPDKLAIFEDKPIRRLWDEKNEKWLFSIVDIVGVLTDSTNPRNYWKVLKNRLKEEGSEVVTNCNLLKLMAKDGKYYFTDVGDVETIFRLVQSVPSPKAEPIKLWLARVGYERVQEIADPERSINRARENWFKMGRDPEWIQRRMMGQEVRNKLTDYWKGHEIKTPIEYAILTNIIHQEWAGVTVKQHKQLKKLQHENLRDHMTEAEIIFTALAEMSTRKIAKTDKAVGFVENKIAGKKGGSIAKSARLALESKTKTKIISSSNFSNTKKLK
jgi:DNA-damage-inducible protein D